MVETATFRKSRISLSDYDYQKDIENRLMMAEFSDDDLTVLEELFFSSLNFSLSHFLEQVDLPHEVTTNILLKLSKCGLVEIENDMVHVDKEMRKYFEAQAIKFDRNFKPGMEFLQGLLRKVPIHVLPSWYAIPKTSNNIFDSLIEKYLQTPQVFQRYLMELKFGDEVLSSMFQEVYTSQDFKVFSKDLIAKHDLSREQFEEYILQLEFHLVACLGYEKVGSQWEEVVTPFHEWHEYLCFLRSSSPKSIEESDKITRLGKGEFPFATDLSAVLSLLTETPLSLDQIKERCSFQHNFSDKYPLDDHLDLLLYRLKDLQLINEDHEKFSIKESGMQWLDLSIDERALYLYRHADNRLPALSTDEKNIKEAEKSIFRVLNLGWVYYDEFLKGVTVGLGDKSPVTLTKAGKSWKYAIPDYSERELELIRATILQWLYQVGIVDVGYLQDKECFCITPLGCSIFGN